ncbi:hypothetical protein OIE75_20280 [Streptomyces sp. NBC_01723]|uniref:hypothetical protein n=1 Tax=Streptomyces sp. NBC_01723 TaxID=2975921 RepID=UPI002E30F7BE|nr:hypothetical protein [Streptomyces sp. NBC_01723]
MSESQSEDTMVAALLREREGLVQRGLDDRVKQVDEQLRLRGHKEPSREQQKPADVPAAPVLKTEAEQRAEPPKGRRQQPKSES